MFSRGARRWAGLGILFAALLIGDQIRLGRPEYKYRLTIEVKTPQGVKSASGVMSVHPNRGYTGTGSGGTRTKGDAVFVDLGNGRNLVMLLLHDASRANADGINYLPITAFAATGRRVSFREVSRQTGTIPVTGEAIPLLVSFTDPADPKTARPVGPDHLGAVLGEGIQLEGITLAVVPVGWWPLDVGGVLGEPVTRGIDSKLPWVMQPGDAAAALAAAGIALAPSMTDPVRAFRAN
jgi:hypothetical protein